jgi:hypothetical protein
MKVVENGMERRTEVRMMCADMMEVRWKDHAGKAQRATALLEDICASGACLQLEIPIALGSEIYWECPKQQFKGYVRYCVYREIGYFIGVEFTPASQWSKKSYKPQHLLDPQRLLAHAKK